MPAAAVRQGVVNVKVNHPAPQGMRAVGSGTDCEVQRFVRGRTLESSGCARVHLQGVPARRRYGSFYYSTIRKRRAPRRDEGGHHWVELVSVA